MKPFFILTIIMMLVQLFTFSTVCADEEFEIVLDDAGIIVGGNPITFEKGKVFLTKVIETHPDVPEALVNVENSVVNITKAGTYLISGKLTDGQILVDAGKKDNVTLILNGVDISCRTAPAILIKNAADPEKAGMSGVTLRLTSGSENIVIGSHIAKDTGKEDSKKYDGAISSKVSLSLDGDYSSVLKVFGDKEGIESKLHVTINDGNIEVHSADDPLNASEDGLSVITINGGSLLFSADKGLEGDGIDSNGKIIINGGNITALANPDSIDSGMDADLGIEINGGEIISAGRDLPMGVTSVNQSLMNLSFQEPVDTIVITFADGDVPLVAYKFDKKFHSFCLSGPEFDDETYHLWTGGGVDGTVEKCFYSEIFDYTGGTQMTHGGGINGHPGIPIGPGPVIPDPSMPGYDEITAMSEDKDKPVHPRMPIGLGAPDPGQAEPEPPEGGRRPPAPDKTMGPRPMGGPQFDSAEVTSDFKISKDSGFFYGNIKPVE